MFTITQNAVCERYNVNPAIDEDFIAWSNSIPLEEAEIQLKDFLSSFDSWEEAKTWFISKGFSVNYGEMNEHVARKHGIYPAFAASASWGPEQGIIFSNGWLQKMESKIFVHGWSVGIRYTENGQFTVHRVKVVATLL